VSRPYRQSSIDQVNVNAAAIFVLEATGRRLALLSTDEFCSAMCTRPTRATIDTNLLKNKGSKMPQAMDLAYRWG
jgi:hypothetical protein